MILAAARGIGGALLRPRLLTMATRQAVGIIVLPYLYSLAKLSRSIRLR